MNKGCDVCAVFAIRVASRRGREEEDESDSSCDRDRSS